MKRRTFFFMGMAGLAGCSRSSSATLNVFNWSDYVAPDTIPNFEKEFGVTVRYSTYESNEEMLAKVVGGNSGWDVVFPSGTFIQPMTQKQLLAPMRHDLLTNLGNLSTVFQAPRWDPKLEYCVPYMWGSTGIVFNNKVAPPLTSWAGLWEARIGGKLTMLDDPADCIGAALQKLSLPWNSTDPVQLGRARQALLDQKPLVRAYVNAEAQDQLVAGDLLAAQAWSTVAAQAMAASRDLVFVFPSEGFGLYADNVAILKESANQELAHQFVNYLLRPAVSAGVAVATNTATANGAAERQLPEEVRHSTTLYPPADVLVRGEWSETLPADAQRLRDEIWTQVKSA